MTKVRKTALLKSLAKTWGAWQEAAVTDELQREHPHLLHCQHIWANNRYEVNAYIAQTPIGGVWQVNVFRHGDLEQITWPELQRIVHELYGPEAVAVEVYPALVDEWRTKSNLRILWVLPNTWPLPFGLHLPGAWGQNAKV
jgi:hypothetical protein